MAIDFPNSPSVGQVYIFAGVTYTFTSQGIWSTSITAPATVVSNITVQRFLSGSGTYTTPTGTQFIQVELIGGGGGGACGQLNPIIATNGGSTTFGPLTGGGGQGGGNGGQGGAGGTATGGDVNLVGGMGNQGGNASDNNVFAIGGTGGNGPFGGAGGNRFNQAALSGSPNTGAGGGGGGTNSVTASYPAPGGGAGGYCRKLIANPAANYAYSVGAGGAGAPVGGNSFAGGDGGSGIIIVTEYAVATGPQGPIGPTASAVAPQGRLTLLAGSPVMTTSQANKTAIIYSPYVGNQIPISDGVNMIMTVFNELVATTADATKSPAAIGISKVNDWFVWNDAGTIRLGHGLDWTDDLNRAGLGGLTRTQGIWVNSNAIANGPAAGRGTFVGTTRSNGSSQIDWIFAGAGVGGVQGNLYVWNMYNRVRVDTICRDTTAQWTYNSTGYANLNVSTNNAVNFVLGLNEDTISVFTICIGSGAPGTLGANLYISLDGAIVGYGSQTQQGIALMVASYAGFPGIGRHNIFPAQKINGSGTATYYGIGSGNGEPTQGFTVSLLM